MKFISREKICSACLENQFPTLRVSDSCIKEVYKSFTGDYQTNIEIYLCNYCKHSLVKISKFINMCVQSYTFLTKNIQSSKFNSYEVAEEKASVQNETNLKRSNTIHISVPYNKFTDYNNSVFTIIHDEDIPPETQFINLKLKKENIDEDSNDPLATYVDNHKVEYPIHFKQETIQSTSETNTTKPGKVKLPTPINREIQIKEENFEEDSEDSLSDCTDNEDVELPVEFDEKISVSSRKLKKETPGKAKISYKLKREAQENMNENITQIKLSREEQIKELEEKKKTEKYLEAIYKCEKCAQTFGLEVSLKKHNMMKHDESRGSYECWLCHTRFPKIDLLKTHSLHHSTKLLCKFCNFESHIRQTMRTHLECHAGVTHPCHICYKVFKFRNTLLNHIETHKLDKTNKKFKCQQCDKAFHTKNILRNHEYIHTDIRPYTCETCGHAFKSKNNLNIHLIKHKEKTGEYYCVECDIFFKTQNNLKCHLDNALRHRDPSMLKFECKQCPMKFKSQKRMDSHIQAVHEKIPKLPCDECGVLFVTRHTLRNHKFKAHDKFVKYGCSTCDKYFFSKAQLDNHIRTHTGERPFECTLCDWKFNQKAALRTHVKLKHMKS